jgi:hypothetical protein
MPPACWGVIHYGSYKKVAAAGIEPAANKFLVFSCSLDIDDIKIKSLFT